MNIYTLESIIRGCISNPPPERFPIVGEPHAPFAEQSLIHVRIALNPDATFPLISTHCGPFNQRNFLNMIGPSPEKLSLDPFQSGTHFFRHTKERKIINW